MLSLHINTYNRYIPKRIYKLNSDKNLILGFVVYTINNISVHIRDYWYTFFYQRTDLEISPVIKKIRPDQQAGPKLENIFFNPDQS